MKLARVLAIPFALAVASAWLSAARVARQDESTPLDREGVRAFMARYCFDCHDAEERKGDHDFTQLGDPAPSSADAWTWELVTEQLSLGEMPPRKAAQPERAEAQAVVEWICAALAGDPAAREPRARLRRLNAFEYRNTVRDLLAIDTSIFDPTEEFPPDEAHAGFDNIGEALVTSSFLLEQQLRAASACIDHAIFEGPRPEAQTLRFAPPFLEWGGDLLPEVVRLHTSEFEELFTRPMGLYGYIFPDAFKDGVPHAGHYVVRVKAAAIGRYHPYTTLHTDASEALRMGIVATPAAGGIPRGKSPSEVQVAEFELADDGARVYEARVWLERGYLPRVTYENGPAIMPMLAFLNLRAEHHPELVGRHAERQWKNDAERLHTEGTDFLRVYAGPRVRVHSIEIEGPHYDAWPPASHTRLLGPDPERFDTELVLTRFARRAFRRPLAADELAPILALVERERRAGVTELEALRTGLAAILCTPQFLYLVEGRGRLDEHALGARLSYFLWSSMPDDELRALADAGELSAPGVLRAQAERLLADPRSKAFVEHFTDGWLGLDKLGSMPPDPERFPVYYRSDLERSMPRESHAFFAHLLATDESIANFLDSDFVVVDSTLARFYGVRGVTTSAFEKAKAPDRRRGGLLGQAAVLTATANGIDTSPVLRGVWVLDTLLGTPPKPPPPGVGALDPDTRGATDIRAQLDKHRADESCNSCHAKIDPMGFPLENYDPVGGWRGTYAESGVAIDASAEAPDGRALRHIGDLKTWLLDHQDQFARALGEKLVTYATGAPVGPADRAELETLVQELTRNGSGLRTLVLLVVESELFASK